MQRYTNKTVLCKTKYRFFLKRRESWEEREGIGGKKGGKGGEKDGRGGGAKDGEKGKIRAGGKLLKTFFAIIIGV
jgi:hypothetical protein